MHIGPHQLSNNLILAPMAGVTDRPFRQLCRQLGAGLAVSEMVSANSALWGNPKTIRRLDFAGESGPISVQILGSDPGCMAEAARVNLGHGAQIIDINMGCPAKKVCRVDAGSALLRDERLVGRILHAVVRAVDVPVTLKIRTGWSPEERNGVRIAQIAEAEGIQAVAVHGRTRACGFSGNAEYHTIRAIKQAVAIPVIANGDIDGPEKAARVLGQTGADAIMIGRAAQGRPWIFREILYYLETGESLPRPGPEWVCGLLCTHLKNLYAFYGTAQGLRVARKHIAWYSKGYPDGAEFRKRINKTEQAGEQLTQVREFFHRLEQREELAA
jgi:tRNA-dihydrouridine synthase B